MFLNAAASSPSYGFLSNMLTASAAGPMKSYYDPLRNACTCTYEVLTRDLCYDVTFTWAKSWTGHSLTLKVQSHCDEDEYQCEISLQSYLFKGNKGRKTFRVGEKEMCLYWDLKSAKYSNSHQPCSGYYIALVSNNEIVALLGDLKDKALNDTQSTPSPHELRLINASQNVYGKSEFSAKITLAQEHEVSIKSSLLDSPAPQMWISIDGLPVVQVMNLNWRFRGNETVVLNDMKLNIFWDVHDWLFNGHGLGQGLFIFKPSPLAGPDTHFEECQLAPEACYFLYAWKTD